MYLCSTVEFFPTAAGLAAHSTYDANIPIWKTIWALYFRRDLAQLEVLRVTHAADQLLRLFAELIEFPQSCSNAPSTSHGSGLYQIGGSVSSPFLRS